MQATPTPSESKVLRLFTRVLVLALLVGLVVLGIYEAGDNGLLPRGQPAPQFTWKTHEGGQVTLEALRGKVVLVNFWATWCPPCIREMPMLVAVAERYASRGVVFVAANADDESQQQQIVNRYLQRKLPPLSRYVAYSDAPGKRAYQVVAFPTTYLIDPQGNIVGAHEGELSETTLKAWLDSVLEKR